MGTTSHWASAVAVAAWLEEIGPNDSSCGLAPHVADSYPTKGTPHVATRNVVEIARIGRDT